MMKRISSLLLLLVVQSPVAGYSQPAYTINDLGTLGGSFSSASAINNVGQVFGTSKTMGGDGDWPHPFLWSPTTGMVDLALVPNPIPIGYVMYEDINDAGQVIGSYTVYGEGGGWRAFLWSSQAGVVELGTMGGTDSIASAINNSGQVVGAVQTTAVGDYHGFLWTEASGMVDLGAGSRWDINEAGQMLGFAGDDPWPNTAFWDPVSGWTILDFNAQALNNLGQVVGGKMIGRSYYPALWSAETGITQLSSLPGQAYAVNNLGQVVGEVWDGSNSLAFLWAPDSGMLILDSLGPAGTAEAYSINDAGQIVGCSNNRAVLWEPIPEPSSLLALAAGIGGMGLVMRKRRG